MPIVPFFPQGGSTPTPSGPTWLDVPTQIESIANTAVDDPILAVTLNSPTNGVGPYKWKVIPNFPWPGSWMGRQYGTGGQTFEVSNIRFPDNQSDLGQRQVSWRVIVEDSLGNWGVGLLIIHERNADETRPPVIIEQVLSPTVGEYQFAARTPPAGVTSRANYNPLGTGFCYPSPVEPSGTTNHEATQFVLTTPPGGVCAISYRRLFSGPPNESERVWLIVRRELDSEDMEYGWGSWSESQDFLDWSNITNISFTTPLGTSSSQTAVIYTNAVTGRNYPAAYLAYAQTAGVTPALEVANITGGVATLTSNSNSGTSSNRQVWLSFFPRVQQTVQDTATRAASLGSDCGYMIRIKFNLTLRGIHGFADFRIGPSATSSANGMRILGRGNDFLYDGSIEPIRFQAVRAGSTISFSSIRRSLMDGQDWGIDFYSAGGQTWLAMYPWDAGWTDFPEYRKDTLDFVDPPANCIGPSQVLQNGANNAPNSPYSYGPWPIAQVDNSQQVGNGNGVIGVHLGMNCGANAATDGGGTLIVKEVKYYWKSMNLR